MPDKESESEEVWDKMAEQLLRADIREEKELEFVQWDGGDWQDMGAGEEEERKTLKGKAPRLHHKKSRKGCQQCRDRRVKVCFDTLK